MHTSFHCRLSSQAVHSPASTNAVYMSILLQRSTKCPVPSALRSAKSYGQLALLARETENDDFLASHDDNFFAGN